MKINITKATLLEGIQIVSSGVSARTTLPILHNFLLETHKGKLKLVRTDMEMATVHYVPAEIEEDAGVTSGRRCCYYRVHLQNVTFYQRLFEYSG